MSNMMIIAGPSTRAAHPYGVCTGHGPELDRVNHFADVRWEQELLATATKRSLSQRPRPDFVSILDQQRASAPPRRSP